MADKPIHQKVAEAVLKKVTPKTRGRLEVTPKGSYSVVADGTGWVARITATVVEFNSKRVDPAALLKAGMVKVGKDEWHRGHDLPAAPASEGAPAKTDGGPFVGEAEVAKGLTAAAKPVKEAK